MKLLIVRAFVLMALPAVVSARGGGNGGGSTHVSGYTRTDGTYVHDYYRSASGAGRVGGNGVQISRMDSAGNFYEGLGPREGDQSSPSASIGLARQSGEQKCEFKPVMTDEDIARCR